MVLNHYIYVQYGCEKQSKVVYRLNQDDIITASFTLNNSGREKHCLYVQYGCDKQSIVVYSLNQEITALFTLDSVLSA